MDQQKKYGEWIPFTEYEKSECDIKLKDGKIIRHVYPNAGIFTGMCGTQRIEINQNEVSEIMYIRYYAFDLCNDNCNQIKL